MAPVLFLFLMSAFAETFEIEWKNAGISVCMMQSVIGTELANGRGKLQRHLPKDYHSRSLTAVKILQCLYVDDRAFIFTTRADLKKGLELVCKHFARFGLEMHIGRGNSPSKTECVFFPPPGFLIHTSLLSNRQILTLTMPSKMNMRVSSQMETCTMKKMQEQDVKQKASSMTSLWRRDQSRLLMALSPSVVTSNILAPSYPSAFVMTLTLKIK
jgi:hypothetical protein